MWVAAVVLALVSSTLRGHIEVLAGIESPQLLDRRDVLVYLPPSYAVGTQRYPVAYLQDGQNVFDAATATFHKEWRADETAEALAEHGQELIVVAIPSSDPDPRGAGRVSEYGPFPEPRMGGLGHGDRYADFLRLTLKPLIDARYRTLSDRAHTAVVGASLGGLISLYAGLRHPDVFGFVGALSPSLWMSDERIFAWVAAQPTEAVPRVYLDVGTREGERPAADVRRCRLMAALLERKHVTVALHIVPGATHDEDAWALRLPDVLRLFLADNRPQ